jgi:hypothetical protein
VYTVSISHSNQGVSTYFFILHKQRTKDYVMQRQKAKADHFFNDEVDHSEEIATKVGLMSLLLLTEVEVQGNK